MLPFPQSLAERDQPRAVADSVGLEKPKRNHAIPPRSKLSLTDITITRGCWSLASLRFHFVLVDEADRMSYPAQLAFPVEAHATASLPNTVVCFTCNSVDTLQVRFPLTLPSRRFLQLRDVRRVESQGERARSRCHRANRYRIPASHQTFPKPVYGPSPDSRPVSVSSLLVRWMGARPQCRRALR
jgi:hypothetical protein